MKKTLLLTLCSLMALSATAQKFVGGDISLLPSYEQNGAKYLDKDGKAIDDGMVKYLKSQGWNAMRVRLFVDPNNATRAEKGQGVRQNLDYVIALGKQIKDKGMAFMLDFHYSDTWADPAKQWTPKDWLSFSDEQLYDTIYKYTKYCLEKCVSGGATPDFIQTGNEISYGMLYGEGVITEDVYEGNNRYTKYKASDSSYKKVYAGQTSNWTRFVNLLKKAGQACREVCPEAKIILHTERTPNPSYLVTYYNQMETDGVDYDIIGLSYYPYHHGSLSVLNTALTNLESSFSDKKINIVETGYYHAWYPDDVTYKISNFPNWPDTDAGQLQFTKDLISTLKNHSNVNGLYWWFPEANEYGLDWNTKRVTDGWYNASLFDNQTGKAMQALYELKNFTNGSSGIRHIQADATPHSVWYSLDGRQLSAQPTDKGLYIHQGKKAVVK